MATQYEPAAQEGSALPALMAASAVGTALPSTASERVQIERQLRQNGAVLLRGYAVTSRSHFSAFAESFGHPLLNYEFGSTPRTALGSGVYTSTEYPAHRSIPLHNEQAYTSSWPMKLVSLRASRSQRRRYAHRRQS